MAAHELPGAIHDHIAAADIRCRAYRLAAQFEAATRALGDPERRPLTPDGWASWEGQAYALLTELARG